MINGKHIAVVLPAYNAALTLRKTVAEIPRDIVDTIILTDDASTDETLKAAQDLDIDFILTHEKNIGYGANQKTCYKKAVEIGADVIIMLHPDYQYTPRLIPSMVDLITNNVYGIVLGSRILGGDALKGGMPLYKYVANRVLTFIQNLLTGAKLSEYHTGYRAFSVTLLQSINYQHNSNGFAFDNELLSQIIMKGYTIAEITCPTKYFRDASSITLKDSIGYGFSVIKISVQHFMHKLKIVSHSRYQ